MRNLRGAGPRQLALTVALLALALLVGRFSWGLPVLGDAERALYDVRSFVTAPHVDQDTRIVQIVYDDQTLIAARKRSPLDRGLLARALQNIDAMGARAIGIDILFDQPQDEDDALVAALRAMRTPVRVAYAEIATNRDDITYEQQRYLDDFLGRLSGSNARPASIRLDYAHGVARVWPDIVGGLPPVLGRAMLADAEPARLARFRGYTGPVRYRLAADPDRPVFSSLRIDLFADPAIAPALADQVRGRYVLIGGDIVDVDRVETSFTAITGESVAGMQVHAAMLAQMLDGARPRAVPGWLLALVGLAVVTAAGLTSLSEQRLARIVPLVALQIGAIAGLPFLLQQRGWDTVGVPSAGWLVAWVLAFLAVGSAARAAGTEQRRFAQGALGKYLPRDIAQEIIDNPELLSLHGRKQPIYVMFSDLEGFTKMSHALEPEAVATLLNRYLEMLSQVVLDHGGVIDKFVGDAVVAFWGAPISRPDDARNAALAGYAIWQVGEEFRRTVPPGLPPVGKTRVGMHYGEAIVGNFGGEGRIQYTALGDTMNTAARLEGANKSLGTSVIASREFAERSQLDWWRPMGRAILRGRAQPVDLFEPAPDFPEEDRRRLGEALAMLETNRTAATKIIADISARYPDDAGLANLLHRTREPGDQDAYVLA
jgi:adenylate cyclase